jgi:hypothetical protein
MHPDPYRRRIVALVFTALALRLALLFAGPWRDPERALQPDSRRYLVLAENLIRHGRFVKREEDGLVHLAVDRLRSANGTRPPTDADGLRPDSFRTPAYPAFVAPLNALGGVRAVLLAQCLLGAAATGLLFGVARRLGQTSTGATVAALLWALHPALVVFDCLLLTESLFNVGVVASSWLAARSATPTGRAGAGLLLGLTGLVRPLGLFFLPSLLVVGWRGQRRWLSAACLVAAAVAPSALWALRNRSAGEGLRVSSVGDVNLLYYVAAHAISEERGDDWFDAWRDRVAELSDRLGMRLRPGEDVYSAGRALAREELTARPGGAIRVGVKSSAKLAVDHSTGDLARLLGSEYRPTGTFSRLLRGAWRAPEGGTSWTVIAAAWTAFNAVLALAALTGLAAALRRRDWRLAVVCGPPLALFALASVAVALERMRLPMLPPMLLLVGGLSLGFRRRVDAAAGGP